MKKILGALFVVSACATMTGAGSGLNRLNQEPKNCEFLYTLNSNATVYNIDDAYKSLETNILEQEKLGDSYLIIKEETVANPGAIFGPKNTYKFKVKVYNCEK